MVNLVAAVGFTDGFDSRQELRRPTGTICNLKLPPPCWLERCRALVDADFHGIQSRRPPHSMLRSSGPIERTEIFLRDARGPRTLAPRYEHEGSRRRRLPLDQAYHLAQPALGPF